MLMLGKWVTFARVTNIIGRMNLFDIFKPEKKMKPMKLTKWEEMYYAVAPAEKLSTKTIETTCSNPAMILGYEKCVFYLEDQHNPVVNKLFGKFYKEIAKKFERLGYTFIYAPKEAEEIAKHYAMPKPAVEWNAATTLEMLQCQCDEPIGSVLAVIEGLNYNNLSSIILSCTSLEADSEEEVTAILKALWKAFDDDANIRFRLSESDYRYEARGEEECMMSSTLFTIDDESAASEQYELYEKRKQCSVNRRYNRSSLPRFDTIACEFLSDVDELTEEDEQLLEEIQARVTKLRQRGIRQHLIEQFIKMTVPTSHLEVTPDARILLTDYKKEVQMLPIDKVVYIFYLRHPEGISIKSLSDHKEELMGLYARVVGKTELTDKQKASVELLCNPLDNSINEKLSRIRKSFCAVVHESVANHYVVQGSRGEERYIGLSEELIELGDWGK